MSENDDDSIAGLSASTIIYALRCAANWLDERGDRSYMDLDDERGQILRWDRDHPDDEEAK